MRLFRWVLVAILVTILGIAIYQTVLWLGIGVNGGDSQVRPLDESDQEIAFIEPATSTDDWGRLVTALKLLHLDWPKINPRLPPLDIKLADAFPTLSAEVPEIVLSMKGIPNARLRLRWYKISGEHDAASWIQKLHARGRPPLAIIGGATSDRAVRLAETLQQRYPDPQKPSPVLLITTATSDDTSEGEPLIQVYARRSFRFSFTNQKMVESLLAFVQQTPNLWVHRPADPLTLANAVASMAASGEPWHAWGVLRGYPHLQPYTMHAVSWEDERYSLDMTARFEQAFRKRYPGSEFYHDGRIRHAVGGFFHPAPQEQDAVGTFLARPTPITPHSFLVLPTQTVRMRRFLINLRQRAPAEARNLVILNGDAIAFHSVYRDRDVMWNILELPYPLVFFSHRNPIDRSAGFTWTRDDRAPDPNTFPKRTTTGTHDFLLYRDLFEAILYAAYDQNRLLDDPRTVRKRLAETCWYHPPAVRTGDEIARVCNARVHSIGGGHERFFDAEGNRKSHTGEHIVWVRPHFTGARVDLTSRISVWALQPEKAGGAWELVESHDALYNQSPQEGAQ